MTGDAAKVRGKQGEILIRDVYEKDKVVFREGQDGNDAFVVESGRIGVFKTIEGKVVRLAVFEKGAMFGEMSAVTGEKRSATTMALEQTVLVRISKQSIQEKIASCDPFVKALIHILINNLARVNERYVTQTKTADALIQNLKASAEKKTP
jgi:CRP-like cAMP-binding protein